MRRKRLLIFVLFLLFIVLTNTPEVSAQIQVNQPPDTGFRVLPGDTGSSLLNTLLNNVITIIFSVSGIAVVFFILWGAFEWITSGADKEKLKGAQKKITTALIGLAVLALAFVLIYIVGSIVGFNPVDPKKPLKLPSLLDRTPNTNTTITTTSKDSVKK